MMNLLIAVVGIIALFGAWIAVQSLVRRHDPDIGEAEDVLACRMCRADGSCHCGLKALRAWQAKRGMGKQ